VEPSALELPARYLARALASFATLIFIAFSLACSALSTTTLVTIVVFYTLISSRYNVSSLLVSNFRQ
jgi:hypothetical protein